MHKNSENAATFSELLGQEDKLSPAPGHNRQQPTARARAVFSYTSIQGARKEKDTELMTGRTREIIVPAGAGAVLCRGEDTLATKTP